MKPGLFFLLLFVSITAFGQTDSLENKANELLQTAKARQLSKVELKEVQTIATTIQNRGFMLEEHQHDYAGSLADIDRSLNIWHQIGDTFAVANLLKYKGYLLGHLNRFPEAKIKIDSAIGLFNAVKYPKGIAVSELDLSRAYELRTDLDSALKYAGLTIPFWKMEKDTFRVITSGNQVINLYLKMKKYDQAQAIQQELIPMFAAKSLYWQPVLEFYFLSAQLFTKLNKIAQQRQYQSLYDDKVKSLKARNVTPWVRYGQYAD